MERSDSSFVDFTHIFWTIQETSSHLMRNSIYNFNLSQIMMQDHWMKIHHMIALYLLHFNKFSCKISQAKYNIFTVLPLFFYFNSLKQPVILPKTASPVWVRMTTSTASGVRKLEDVPMALIGCDKNGEIKAAKFRYTAGYFCVVILVFVIVF